MSVSKIKRVRVVVTIPEKDYQYIEKRIKKTNDSVKTVPGYVRRLVKYYVWSLRVEEEIKASEEHLRELRLGLEEWETPEKRP